MRRLAVLLIPLLLIGTLASPVRAQQGDPPARPWWIGGEIGEGQLRLSSDQSTGPLNSTFALGFVGGHSLGSQARFGAEINGWLLQASSLNNPAVGESVSDAMGIADVFPIAKVPLFLRAGAGGAFYTNNRPEGYSGSGWAWTVGGGYEFRIAGQMGLAPMVGYSGGTFGDVRNPITVETGRRYSVVEFKVDVIWHFGRRK